MIVNECIWEGMKLCDGIGMHMMVYGCISANMDVYESKCWYINLNGSKWEYWKYMKLYDGVWIHIKAYECIWAKMIVYESIW